MAEINLKLDDNGSIQAKIDKIHEVIAGIEHIKKLVKEISQEEITLTVNGETYVKEEK